MQNKITPFIQDEDGATAAEYAIMVSLIAVVVVAAVTALGLAVNALFSEAADEFDNF